MDRRIEEDVEGWPTRPVDGGFDGLRQLAAADFSGAVRASGATMFLLNGRIVGTFDGSLETFEDASGTAHKAPHRSLPLLYAMQTRGGETQGKYYTEDTPISEVDQTLSDGNFTGFLELSENVLSGDYYLVYHAGRSMSVAFVGTSGKLLTGEEAFERADDEVGIYEVTAVDVDVRNVPGLEGADPDDASESTDAAAADDAAADDGAADQDAAADEATADGAADDAAADTAADDSPADDGSPGREDAAAGEDPAAPPTDDGQPDATGGAEAGAPAGETSSPDRDGAGGDSQPAAKTGAEAGTGQVEDGAHGGETLRDADSGASGSRSSGGEPASTGGQASANGPSSTGGPASSAAGEQARDASRGAGAASGASGGADGVARPAPDAAVDGPTVAEATTIPSLDPDRSGDLEQLAQHPDAMAGSRGHGGGQDGRDVDDALEREVLEREDRIDRLQQRASNLRAERDELAAERDRLVRRVEELEAENEELERRLRGLEERVDGEAGGSADDAGDGPDAGDEAAGEGGSASEAGGAAADASGEQASASGADETAASQGGAHDRASDAGGASATRDREEAAGAPDGPAADADLRPAQALDGTDLFVRYDSKSRPTLEDVRGGADRTAVDDNLRLDLHTRFDADAATVSGAPFRSFLEETMAYRFVEWLVRELPYEIRGTGQEAAMRDCYDALPTVDRVEFNGVVELSYEEDGETVEAEEAFDVVVRDRMGNPLFVADMNDSRDPADAGMLLDLQSGATRVKEAEDALAGGFAVTRSFFDPDALETAAEATSGSLLSRDSRKSYVRVSRKRGYHLCLVEAREGNLHLNVPEL